MRPMTQMKIPFPPPEYLFATALAYAKGQVGLVKLVGDHSLEAY